MEKIFNLDFYDMFFDGKGSLVDLPNDYYSAEMLESLIQKAVTSGFSIINYRAAVCGKVLHHSTVKEMAIAPKSVANTLKIYDPAKVAVKAAHNAGAECYIWITPFDDYGVDETIAPADDPGCFQQSDFSKSHPEYQLCSRDGNDQIWGEYCFGYQEVKDYWLSYVKELLEYQPDGIFFSNRTHSNIKLKQREYGFNKPVIARYKQLYGGDPREETHYDLEKFSEVLGDFYTEFLADAAKDIHAAGAKVMHGISWRRDGLIAARLGRLDKCFFQWEHWLTNDLVDELVIGGDAATGNDPEHCLAYFETLAESCNPDYFRKIKTKAKIYRWITLFFWGWSNRQQLTDDGSAFTAETIKRMLEILENASLDGILCHEAVVIENQNLWKIFNKKQTREMQK